MGVHVFPPILKPPLTSLPNTATMLTLNVLKTLKYLVLKPSFRVDIVVSDKHSVTREMGLNNQQ